MKYKNLNKTLTIALLVVIFSINFNMAQQLTTKNNFWDSVQFGGGLGLGLGSGYTDIMVAPSAIYNFNEYVAFGIGLQYSYVSQRNFYSANMYGGSALALLNPIPEVQVSMELEQLRVNRTFENEFDFSNQNFWNTALFFGVGYRNENITVGIRYNVLHKDRNNIYTEAFMPFVRVFF